MFKKLFTKIFGPSRAAPDPDGLHGFSFERKPADSGSDGRRKPKAVADWEAAANRSVDRNARPEDLCGITPEMSMAQIREHLAMLYRRHNRAASSLDSKLREEAEVMLDAIVQCREKFCGRKPPGTSRGAA